MQSYDLIPDVHGNHERLTATLRQLGYDQNRLTHPEGRIAAFLGDFIDRGTENASVLRTIRKMVEQGSAIAIMGNHELNAILFHTRGEDGKWLRRHSPENLRQHKTFLDEFAPGSAASREVLAWMMSLPLYADLGGLRMVHASWDDRATSVIASRRPDLRLREADLPLIAREDEADPFAAAVNLALKGPERRLPAGAWFEDNKGNRRHKMRLKWWQEDPQTWRDLMISVPDASGIPDAPFPQTLLPALYPVDAPPVFVGHYQRRGPVVLERDNVACLDHPEVIAAYSWDGEDRLDPGKIMGGTARDYPSPE